jgi:CII-binding regulator of phage lambda lysogenization HflD
MERLLSKEEKEKILESFVILEHKMDTLTEALSDHYERKKNADQGIMRAATALTSDTITEEASAMYLENISKYGRERRAAVKEIESIEDDLFILSEKFKLLENEFPGIGVKTDEK